MKRFQLTAIFATALFVVGLGSAALTASAQETKSPIGAKHVVWIGSDGFGSHYINWDELPNLKKMKENGAWTVRMRSVLPSSSAINWETQIAGAPSEMHGYRTWGSKEPDLPPIYLNDKGRFPCIFGVLKDELDAKSTVVYSWDGIGYLYEKSAPVADQFVKTDEEVFNVAVEQLATKPDFAFIYFSEPDIVGHGIGWGTPEYQTMLTKIDDYVGKLLAKIDELGMADDTVVIFTADHGGTGKGHGEGIMEHMEVPFMLYGKNVKTGEISDVVVHFDVAATIAWILGANRPQAWRGVPVESAFVK